MRPLVTWSIRRAGRFCGYALSTVEHRDIDYALAVARKRHGHDVTVDNLAWLKMQRRARP